MDFETLKPLFVVLFGIILSSFEPVWKLLQLSEFLIQLLATRIMKSKAGYFFVHFSAGQLRPMACGTLSFEGKNVSSLSKNASFFSHWEFFSV